MNALPDWREVAEGLDDALVLTRELEDVAAKSKLLAFNAAIVAAQAGEHGRSFAVVAEQMKSLNLRAQKAARALSEQTVFWRNRVANRLPDEP